MPKAHYLPFDDPGKCTWFNNFAMKLPTYSATLGITPAEEAAVADDNTFWQYVCEARNQFHQYAKDWTAYKNHARNGTAIGDLPTPPTLPAAPGTLVAANIFGRITTLVARIKKHPGYTEAIGQDLDIIGAEQTVDLNTLKPVLKLVLQAGRPNVQWKKTVADALELQVDRGNGFVFLAIDTVPDYLDTFALPAAGASAVWKYKAIYRINDEQVGQWSDVSSISVMG